MNDHGNQIVFGRRMLSKDAAATWQFQSKIMGDQLGLSVQWHDWPFDCEKDRPLSAVIVGVSYETLAPSLTIIQAVREECKNVSPTKTFLLVWFPEADLQVTQVLLESGVDRIVSKAQQIPEALRQIYQIGFRSNSKTHPWLEKTALSRLF